MGLSLGFGSQSGKSTTSGTSTTNSSAQRDPWDVTIPALKDFVGQIEGLPDAGATQAQTDAFNQLKANAAQGNPYTGDIDTLAGDLFATADRSGMVSDAYGTLQGQLGKYANGDYLDPFSNPQMAAMLQSVGDDVQSRVNQSFAAAGRDMSGKNQGAVGRGITAAQLPLLLDQFNKQQANQMNAATSLYGAGRDTASTIGSLDQQRAQLRAMGIDVGDKAMDAKNYGANSILNLEQQEKMLPIEDLAAVASLLFPAAQLGGQEDGTSTTNSKSTTKSKSSGFSLGL